MSITTIIKTNSMRLMSMIRNIGMMIIMMMTQIMIHELARMINMTSKAKDDNDEGDVTKLTLYTNHDFVCLAYNSITTQL